MIIKLRSARVAVVCDPSRGGEIVDIIDVPSGRQLLGRTPFTPTAPVIGDVDEPTWIAAYRGGWQLLTPNAGAASIVDGRPHSYHGAASHNPWHVVAATAQRASLTWSGHGLDVVREVAVDGEEIEVTTQVRARRGVPMVVVEHLTVGADVIGDGCSVELPADQPLAVDDHLGNPAPEIAAMLHPGRGGHSAGAMATYRVDPSIRTSRAFKVKGLARGSARVVGRSGLGLELRWDIAALPYLWVWHEIGNRGGIWDRRGAIVGIEPASVPHEFGLAEAVARGDATHMRHGEIRRWTVVVRLVTSLP